MAVKLTILYSDTLGNHIEHEEYFENVGGGTLRLVAEQYATKGFWKNPGLFIPPSQVLAVYITEDRGKS